MARVGNDVCHRNCAILHHPYQLLDLSRPDTIKVETHSVEIARIDGCVVAPYISYW